MEVKGFEVEGVIKVDNVRIYGIEESIIASGYPMQTETFNMNEINLKVKDLKRAKHLGNAIPGSGHDCFTKGITGTSANNKISNFKVLHVLIKSIIRQ